MVALVCSLLSVVVLICIVKVLAAINLWMFHVYPVISCILFALNIMLLEKVTMTLLVWNRNLATYEWDVLSMM